MKSTKGASSVLVILMMVVLIALGLAALTTSLAAMRLGDKSGEWNRQFYLLDAKAGMDLATIDGYIAAADIEAKEYLEGTNEFSISDPLKAALMDINNDTQIYRLVFWERLALFLDSSDINMIENGPGSAVSGNLPVEHIPVIRFCVTDGGSINAAIEIYGQEHENRFKVIEWIYISPVPEKTDE